MAGEKINLAYLHEVLPKNEGLLKELEAYAKAHEIPIMQPEDVQLMRVLCMLKKPEKILEIGTAIGYSAIIFS